MENVIHINSVIGFDLKYEIKDQYGNVLKTGAKTTYPTETEKIFKSSGVLDINFFNHYNEALLNKIRAVRNLTL